MIEVFKGGCSKVLVWAVGVLFDSGLGLETGKGVGVMI